VAIPAGLGSAGSARAAAPAVRVGGGRLEIANQSGCGFGRATCEKLQPVGLNVCEVAAIPSIAEAVVGLRQRPASDAEERREFSIASTAEALRDVAGHRGCRVADLIAEFEIP